VETASHSGHSPVEPVSSPKSAGPKPLHGGLRAGQTIVYVLDRSASMGVDGLLVRAVAALKASLGQLGPDVRFQIVAYNGGTAVMANEPVSATPGNIQRAIDWMKAVTAEGRSEHRAGFCEALGGRPDILFLLTDADDLDVAEVRAINGMLRTPVVLSAAVFGARPSGSETPLERLVNRTGGSVTYLSGD
jgi:hypothetical protein